MIACQRTGGFNQQSVGRVSHIDVIQQQQMVMARLAQLKRRGQKSQAAAANVASCMLVAGND